MSKSALTRKLQIVYPLAVFMAVLASAGMTVVQAGGSDLSHLFPNNQDPRINRTIASTEIRACSISDGQRHANRALSCPDDDGVGQWSVITEGDGRLASRVSTKSESKKLN